MKSKKTRLGRFFIVLTSSLVLVLVLAACDDSMTVDKAALMTAITNAEAVKAAADYEDYTQESRASFEDAFAVAKTVNNKEDATQSQVDTAKNNLVGAQNDLTVGNNVEVDKTALQTAITNAGAVKAAAYYEDYTQESRTAFEDALTACPA